MAFGAVGAPQGVKRHADDDLQNDQRLAKRFNRLNLETYGLLRVPIEAPLPTPPVAAFSPQESMLIDDTRHRVYIHDLEEEIKQAEADEQKSIFLPDVEKKISKIPQTVLSGSPSSAQDKQMVLYKIPVSLTVPQEKDSVRKAIIESRERTRAEQAKSALEASRAPAEPSVPDPALTMPEQAVEDSQHTVHTVRDPDEMDIG